MRLYIATSWTRAEWCDTVLRAALERAGATIVSTWHAGPWQRSDPFSTFPKARRQEIYRTNCDEIASADAMLVILDEFVPEPARPRQTYAELARGVMLGLDVIVVGPPFPPECEAPRVRIVTSIADAVRAIGEAVDVKRASQRRVDTLPAPPDDEPALGDEVHRGC